jgi:GTP-binding protein LepA
LPQGYKIKKHSINKSTNLKINHILKHIRNFCIIAHIDHGKSTLADRILEMTSTVAQRDMQSQTLDDMDLERERGITIKSKAIQIDYKSKSGQVYTFNLIDTPGHVDFSYEVSRSLAACEGALLLVDASQGIQAQTISNMYLALENDLELIPVLNKVDMESAMIEEVSDQIIDLLGCRREEILHASGKSGMGVAEILEAIIDRIPPPKGDTEAPLQALIFDSVFNSYRGVIAYFRVKSGKIRKNDKIKFMNTGAMYNADEVGVLKMDLLPKSEILTGDVGYVVTGIKNAKEIKVGDTITLTANPAAEVIHGFENVKPMVFAGIFPVENDDFEELRDALDKLQLNDASLTFEPESSQALGFGFRCGFLGLLHLDIVQERLDREYDQNIITTIPNVSYYMTLKNGTRTILNNPADMPDPTHIEHIEEPYIRAQVITTPDYMGAIMNLAIEKRGMLRNQAYLSPTRLELTFELPLAEIVFDFYDRLKSISRGYASFDYVMTDYRISDLVKLDIKLNGENVDALSALVHRSKAEWVGRKMCAKLKDLLPRQQFLIAIQAGIGAKIIARETLSALRKDVTAKCYGGDISRKRKLLDKQKEGKKRMRQFGNVEVPQRAFLDVLKLD